jgi:hypothetical protein
MNCEPGKIGKPSVASVGATDDCAAAVDDAGGFAGRAVGWGAAGAGVVGAVGAGRVGVLGNG